MWKEKTSTRPTWCVSPGGHTVTCGRVAGQRHIVSHGGQCPDSDAGQGEPPTPPRRTRMHACMRACRHAPAGWATGRPGPVCATVSTHLEFVRAVVGVILERRKRVPVDGGKRLVLLLATHRRVARWACARRRESCEGGCKRDRCTEDDRQRTHRVGGPKNNERVVPEWAAKINERVSRTTHVRVLIAH